VNLSGTPHMGFGLSFRRDKALHDLMPIVGPELLSHLRARMCSDSPSAEVLHLEVVHCDVATRSVAGRKSLAVTFALTDREKEGSYRVLLLVVPYADGALLAGFGVAGEGAEITDAAVESVFRSVTLKDDSEPAPEVVRLMPAPGFSIGIPKGWVACDEDDNARLGGVADAKHRCAEREGQEFLVYNPEILRSVFLMAAHSREARLSERGLREMPAGAISPELSRRICERVSRHMPTRQYSFTDCSGAVALVGGRPSFGMKLVGAEAGKPMSRFEAQVFIVPYERGEVVLIFLTPVILSEVTGPIIANLIASVEIGESI
jgi:hypothetical protein